MFFFFKKKSLPAPRKTTKLEKEIRQKLGGLYAAGQESASKPQLTVKKKKKSPEDVEERKE